jgi:hypothetical protein
MAMHETDVVGRALSPQGRTVEITKSKWAYVTRHVEMRGRFELLLTAIRRPDFQDPDARPGRERYWLLTRRSFQFRWLRVVVQFEGDVDRVVTAFGQDSDPDGYPR